MSPMDRARDDGKLRVSPERHLRWNSTSGAEDNAAVPDADAVRLVPGRLERRRRPGTGNPAPLLRSPPRRLALRSRRGPRLGRLLPPPRRPPRRPRPHRGRRDRLPDAQLALRRRSGTCIDIPYSPRINKQAKVRTYPVRERNGLLLAWYHPTDAPPGMGHPRAGGVRRGRRVLRGVPARSTSSDATGRRSPRPRSTPRTSRRTSSTTRSP